MSKYIKLEDAIYIDCILMDKIECKDCSFYDEERNVCRMVEWLESLPTIEVSEDCIDRKALLEQKYKAKDIFDTEYEDWFVFVPTIEKAPSVVPRLDKEDLEDIYEHISESYIEGYMDGHAEGEWVDKEGRPIPDQHAVYCSLCGIADEQVIYEYEDEEDEY